MGTATFLVHAAGRGLLLQEPSVIAIDEKTREVRAVGSEAHRMLGRTPGGIVTVQPVRDGVIADEDLTEKMMAQFLKKVQGQRGLLSLGGVRPRMMIGVPSGVSDVERRAVLRAALRNNARRAYLIEEPLAAALGADLPVLEPVGSMVIDVGGGSTDIAVISLGGIVVSESLRIAGDEFDASIIHHLRRKHGLIIGERTAEEIKRNLGAAMLPSVLHSKSAQVRGRELHTGLPRSVTVSTLDVIEALSDPLTKIVEAVRRVLESTPPELLGDLVGRGIVMTGGGSLLSNFDELIHQTTGLPVRVAPNAVEAVALGTGLALNHISELGASLVSETYLRR